MNYRFALAFAVCLPMAVPSLNAAPSVVGNWEGTLDIGPQKLQILLHITKDDSGPFVATLDSPDQGATGLLIDSMVLEGNKLEFKLNRLKAGYEGTLAEDGESIDGTWFQGFSTAPLRFRRATAGEPVKPKPAGIFEDAALESILGAWTGTLSVGPQSLQLVVRVEKKAGVYHVQMDSPDRGATGILVSSIEISGRTVVFEIQKVRGSFAGKLDERGGKMTGLWTQAGQSYPLVLERSDKAPEARRPQNPRRPYPYEELEVSFPGGAEGVTLAGTLTLPRGRPPFPAVVLISGSGPQDRDEAVMGHKPFLVLADHLTRRGIAVLRYDDRGTAASTGNFPGATTADHANDAEAALRYLARRGEVARVGLIGHSEGAMIAPIVANREDEVSFVVLLACPGVPGDEIILSQNRKTLELRGASEEKIEQRAELMTSLVKVLKSDQPIEKARAHFDKVAPGVLLPPNPSRAMSDAAFESFASPWMRYFLKYDPVPDVSALAVPALALWGGKDVQVIPELNAPPIRQALEAAEVAGTRIEILPSLNHLFQECKTGDVIEYARIEETISPEVLKLIADWITERTTTPTND